MARATKAKGPDEQVAELDARRVELAMKRHEADAAASAAQRVIDEAPERRRAVLLVEARGETPSSATVEDVDRARRAAEIAKADALERSAALRTVEGEVGEQVQAVIDANPAHFIAKAEAASEAASETIAAAVQAAQAAVASWREAGEAWSTVRMSYRRRSAEMPPEVPVSDLGQAVLELEKAHSRPFPGGSRASWERYREREAAERASTGRKTSLSAAEALMQVR